MPDNTDNNSPSCRRKLFIIIRYVVIFTVLVLMIASVVLLFTAIHVISKAEDTIALYERQQNPHYPRNDNKTELVSKDRYNDALDKKETEIGVIVVTLLFIPIHSYGLYGVIKQSFTISVSYAIIVTVFTLIAFFVNPFDRVLALIVQIVFNLLIVGYCYALHTNKRNKYNR